MSEHHHMDGHGHVDHSSMDHDHLKSIPETDANSMDHSQHSMSDSHSMTGSVHEAGMSHAMHGMSVSYISIFNRVNKVLLFTSSVQHFLSDCLSQAP